MNEKQKANHMKRYPVMKLHSAIVNADKRHWSSPKADVVSEYGKGKSLYAVHEGGTWQKWPWNWVPCFDDMTVGDEPIFGNQILMTHPEDGSRNFKMHSLLMNGQRWDCINGWTS